MKRRVILTKDGSSSIYDEDMRENYHSDFGALAESQFIYIESGMKYSKANPLNVLEIGFGTGLNALLTLNEAVKTKRKTKYYTIEKYPLNYAVTQNNLGNAYGFLSAVRDKEDNLNKSINAYEEACAKYLDKKVDRKRFQKMYRVEVPQLVEKPELKDYFDAITSRYKAILKVYEMWENAEK